MFIQSPLRQRLDEAKQLIPLKSFIYDSLLIKEIQNLRYVQELFKAKTIRFSLNRLLKFEDYKTTMDIVNMAYTAFEKAPLS